MAKRLVGVVRHFYQKIGVAVLDLESDLKVGQTISVEGPETDVQEAVGSMQVDKEQVMEAKAGSQVAVKMKGRVKEEDYVYLEG